ncbi:MAG: hypothetical protein L0226_04820 [Acidobacteria bacterium]|nr:hypothetical protein [Acidobacteriota bacterium]
MCERTNSHANLRILFRQAVVAIYGNASESDGKSPRIFTDATDFHGFYPR